MSFTQAELEAQDQAFREHRLGKCPSDCGFCEDLRVSGPAYTAEYWRIQGIKARGNPPRPQKKAPPPKPVSKKEAKRRAKVKQQMDADRRYHTQMCRPEKKRHDPYS